ncbi:Rcs stress response system protein RcsF [Shewanella sp. YIC-542]|uniref:Rcs stress response system protein RcsF n=1 Tax=Shewanella mytili TaxID=3377111 RepID=UPI00398F5AF3
MKHLVFLPLAVLLGACGSNYTFNSNLNKKAFKEYFKPSEVKLFDHTQPTVPYDVLGLVQGTACQSVANSTPASLANARTDARRKAADIKANGLIIKSCTQLKEPEAGCYSSAVCVGQAIRLQVQD